MQRWLFTLLLGCTVFISRTVHAVNGNTNGNGNGKGPGQGGRGRTTLDGILAKDSMAASIQEMSDTEWWKKYWHDVHLLCLYHLWTQALAGEPAQSERQAIWTKIDEDCREAISNKVVSISDSDTGEHIIFIPEVTPEPNPPNRRVDLLNRRKLRWLKPPGGGNRGEEGGDESDGGERRTGGGGNPNLGFEMLKNPQNMLNAARRKMNSRYLSSTLAGMKSGINVQIGQLQPGGGGMMALSNAVVNWGRRTPSGYKGVVKVPGMVP